MLDFKSTLRTLCGIMSVPGFEADAAAVIGKTFGPYFDSFTRDGGRNQIFLKKSTKPGTHPLLMLDAHFDEVGMVVSDVTERGFLRLMPVGGIDRRLLPASRVRVYPGGWDGPVIPGVIGYCPPELLLPGEKTPQDWDSFLCDIGCTSRDEVFSLGIGIGTPVGYMENAEDLSPVRIKGRGFDDKASAAVLLCAAANIPAGELDYDLALTLSAGEEVGGGGAKSAAYGLMPDLALIADVNFAATPGVDGEEGGKFGAGPMISLSAVCDRPLTKALLDTAKTHGISVTTTVEPTSTGTNASSVVYAREGIPAAVIGVPLGGMHSSAEVLDTRDADAMIRLLTLFMGGADPGPIPEEKPKEENKEAAAKTGGEEKAPESGKEAEDMPPLPVKPLDPRADFDTLLRELAEEFGPSGCEGRVAEKIRGFAGEYADEVFSDRLGSVIAVLRRRIDPEEYDALREPVSGNAPDCGRLALFAHMDEAGFMLRQPDGDGYLHPAALSAKEPMVLNGEDVWVGNEERLTAGYFGVKPAHLGGSGDFDALYVDIGAENGDEAEKRVKKGDFGAYRTSLRNLGSRRVTGKALSGRWGCAVLLDLVRRLKTEEAALPFDCCFVFTTRELIGGSSAPAAAYRIGADAAFILDGLAADDMRESADKRYGAGCEPGSGVSVPYMDRGVIFDRELTAYLCETAKAQGIPASPYRFAAPASDGGAVNRSGEGVRCAMMGLPVRNRLTAGEVMDRADLAAARELAYFAVMGLGER